MLRPQAVLPAAKKKLSQSDDVKTALTMGAEHTLKKNGKYVSDQIEVPPELDI